jgi:energy-coupling factor transporter ATP-binding protein EcfA2
VRRARAEDHWRRVCERHGSLRLASIQLENIRGLGGPNTAIPVGQFIAVCGHNGSGKTTLLRCIEACLREDMRLEAVPELGQTFDGKITLGVEHRGEQAHVTYSLPRGFRDGRTVEGVYYFQPSADTPDLIRILRETPDLEEIIETAEPRQVDSHLFSYLVGKTYERITVYEIEVGEDTSPYYKVEAHGATYGSEAMGLGEFSMFYLLWWLDSLPRESLVLIEEPEAFISPRSQSAVANALVKFTDEKRLFCLTTTHSPMLLNSVPPDCIRVLVRNGPECELVQPSEYDEHLAVLGVERTSIGILFVEDMLAQYALESALEQYAPSVLRAFSIVRGGSWSDILTTLNGIPVDGHPKSFVGVLDADQRDSNRECKWPLYYLPGDGAPDRQLCEAVYSNMDGFAEGLNRRSENISMQMANLHGIDPHDWPHEFARQSGIEVIAVAKAMARCWVRDERWAKGAEELASALRDNLVRGASN